MTRTDTPARKCVHVAVGVIYGADGKILVAQRAASQHLGGLWEFPGGKVEPGESVNAALTRELQEELGIYAVKQSHLCKISHDYGDKSVLLDVWMVKHFDGEPHGREGQPLRWLAPQELRYEDFPEANRAIIRAINLPDYVALVSADADTQLIQKTLSLLPENCLVRLRRTDWPQAASSAQSQLLAGLQTEHHRIIVDLADASDENWRTLPGISGVHANRHVLTQLMQRPVPEHLLFGASCHDADELDMAAACGADYALLSPVQSSNSHPEQSGMGWEKFGQLANAADIAVYAMGGLQKSDLLKARACGARGIAGIRLFK